MDKQELRKILNDTAFNVIAPKIRQLGWDNGRCESAWALAEAFEVAFKQNKLGKFASIKFQEECGLV